MTIGVNRCGRAGGWLAAVMVSTALGGVALPGAVLAQQAQAGTAQDQRHAFDIPAQALADALPAFGRQAGLQVSAHGSVIQDARTNGVAGTMTTAQALGQLLAGTGISWRLSGSTVILEKVAADGAMTLDPVNVEGAAPAQTVEESAYGPVQGYVAKRTSTATKSDAEILTTPQSISVVGAEEMETRNVQTLEDAVKYVPGVHLTYGATGDARASWYSVRGFSSYATYYQDGLKNTGTWLRPDMYLIERTEVLRGPSSVMYGQNIPGGMFNLVTKKPQDVQAGEAAVEYGSYDWKRAEGDITGPLTEDKHWLYRVVAVTQESGGLNGLDHDRNDVKLFAPSLTWKPQDGTALTVGAVRQEAESRGWSPNVRYRTAAGTTSRSTFLGEPDYDRYAEEQTQLNLALEQQLTDSVKVDLTARYAKLKLDYRQMWPDAVQADGVTISRSNYNVQEEDDIYALDARLTAKASFLSAEHTFLGGMDYFYRDKDWQYNGVYPDSSINIFSPGYGTFTNLSAGDLTNTEDRMPGIYAQDQISVDGKWHVLIGGRQDLSGMTGSSGYQDTFTSRFGLAYKTDFGLVPYASYGESFEPQSGTGWGGTKFEPTTGRQYEVGLKYEPPGTNAIATIALFDLRKQNVLTTDPDTSHVCGGGQCQIQTGEVMSRGLELGLTMGLAEGLNAVASYTYNPVSVSKSNVDGEVGRQLYDTPIHLASVWLDYGIQDGPLGGLGFGGGLRFVGKTTNYAGDLSTSPYVQDEYMVRYDVNDWRLSLNVKNLFDREIEYMCDRQTYAETCYLQEPLTVTARVARKF